MQNVFESFLKVFRTRDLPYDTLNYDCPKNCQLGFVREDNDGNGFYVYCDHCLLETPKVSSPELAVAIWNDEVWREQNTGD